MYGSLSVPVPTKSELAVILACENKYVPSCSTVDVTLPESPDDTYKLNNKVLLTSLNVAFSNVK